MVSQERARRSPVPRDPKTWAREVDGIQGFLTRLPTWAEHYGAKWAEKQEAYYRSRLEWLLANRPPERKVRKSYGKRNRNRPRS